MLKRDGIRKTITGGKILEAFNLVDVVDEKTGKVVKKAIAVDTVGLRNTQTGEVTHKRVTSKSIVNKAR